MALQVMVTSSPEALRDCMTGEAARKTLTVKLRVALRGGEPSSETRRASWRVLGPGASLGGQVNTPLLGWIRAPAGAPGSRLNVSALAGRSASLATLVTTRLLPSRTV